MLTVYLILQVIMVDGNYAGSVPVPIAYYDMASCELGARDWVHEHGGESLGDDTTVAYVCSEYNPTIN